MPRAGGRGPWQRLHPQGRRRYSNFSLPRATLAHGKGFAECPINGPRQKPSLPTKNSRRALCRGLLGLCRGLLALGKEGASSSDWSGHAGQSHVLILKLENKYFLIFLSFITAEGICKHSLCSCIHAHSAKAGRQQLGMKEARIGGA